MFKQQKYVGLLNKLTEANLAVLTKEFVSLNFEKGEDEKCAEILVAKSVTEPQFSHLFAAIVKGTPVAVVLRQLQLPAPPESWDEGSKKNVLGRVRLFCNLRKFGVLPFGHFNDQLRQLLKWKCEALVEAVAVVRNFREIVSVETWGSLVAECAKASEESTSLKVRFLAEELIGCNVTSLPDKSAQQAAKSEQQRVALRCTVYFSNVDSSISEWQLATALNCFGALEKVRLCGNPCNATVFAFVEFESEVAAQRVVEHDGKHLLGNFALRSSFSKTVIQDKSNKDAVYGKWGKVRPCSFGFLQSMPSNTTLRRSMRQ
jgi:hypothetical protein